MSCCGGNRPSIKEPVVILTNSAIEKDNYGDALPPYDEEFARTHAHIIVNPGYSDDFGRMQVGVTNYVLVIRNSDRNRQITTAMRVLIPGLGNKLLEVRAAPSYWKYEKFYRNYLQLSCTELS